MAKESTTPYPREGLARVSVAAEFLTTEDTAAFARKSQQRPARPAMSYVTGTAMTTKNNIPDELIPPTDKIRARLADVATEAMLLRRLLKLAASRDKCPCRRSYFASDSESEAEVR